MAHSGKRLALFDNTAVTCEPLQAPPPKLSVSHLNHEGKLLSSQAIARAQAFLKLNPEVDRILVKEGNVAFHVIKLNHPDTKQDDLYIVYFGNKHQALLGEGGFGSVRLMQHAHKKTWHALKTKPIEDDTRTAAKNNDVEIEALSRLSLNLGCFERLGKTTTKLSIGMPLCQGTRLDQFIDSLPSKPYVNLLPIAMAIIAALQALHQRGELHGDFNPYNIFYDTASSRIQLIDFDNCKKIGAYPNGAVIYKIGYVAPEDNLDTYDIATEIYCLGVTLGKLFALSEVDTRHNGFQWAYSFYQEDSPEFKNNRLIQHVKLRIELLHFLKRMTDLKPEKRPSHDEINAFFKDVFFRYLTPATAARRIALIDVNELFGCIDNDKAFSAFIAPLAHLEEIWLVDAKSTYNKKAYEKLLSFLNLFNLPVRHFIWRPTHCNTITLAMTLSAIVKNAPQTLNEIPNSYFFFTAHQFKPEIKDNLSKLGIAVITDQQDLAKKIEDHIGQTLFVDAIYLQVKGMLEEKCKKLQRQYPNNSSAQKKLLQIHHVLEVLAHQYAVHDLSIESMKLSLRCLEDTILKTAHSLIQHLDQLEKMVPNDGLRLAP